MADYTTAILALIFLPYILFQRLGGYPEAWYRISRKPYFIDYIRGPDKRYRRHVDLLENIDTSSGLALWPFGNGVYHHPESEAALSANGATMYFHQWDDTRAIPQYMDTVVGKDGKATLQFRPKIPPAIIAAGLKSKVARDIHREEAENPGPSGFKWYTVTILAVLILVTMATLYFSWNAYCGNHPTAC